MTPCFQYPSRDPLSGVLDYIVEVRLPRHDRSPQLYLARTKEMSRGRK
jgi:hypothetical protein